MFSRRKNVGGTREPHGKNSHGVPAHDQALQKIVTSFHLILRLTERDLGEKVTSNHRRPAFRAGTRGQTTILCKHQYNGSAGLGKYRESKFPV